MLLDASPAYRHAFARRYRFIPGVFQRHPGEVHKLDRNAGPKTQTETLKLWEGKTQSDEIGDPVTMLELISLLRTLAGLFRDRRDLVVENLLLRHQLHVALRSHPRPDLKTRDRFLWLVVRRLVPDWKQHLISVQPETVVRWHRQGWRLCWRWRSGHHLGRPRLSLEIRELIATMASANRLWGTERIRGELLKLVIVSVLARSGATVGVAICDAQPELAHLSYQPC
jgi:hypothetical protein